MLIPQSWSVIVAVGAGALAFALPLALIYVIGRRFPGALQRRLLTPLSVLGLLMPLPVGYFFHAAGKTVLIIDDADGMRRSDWLAYGDPLYRFRDGSERRVGGPSFLYAGSIVVNDTRRPLTLVEMRYYIQGTPAASDNRRTVATLPPMSVTSRDHPIRFFGWGDAGPAPSVPVGANASTVLVYWLTWPRAGARGS